jgi:phosphoglycerate dehydrogenase-like enzyme
MQKDTILVLASPTEPQLAMLEELRPENDIVAGNTLGDFEKSVPETTIILNWSGSLHLLREVFLMCPEVRWVHSRSAGLERSLFAELIESPVPLTNGTGVYSPALGEFALATILYFAKDFRRMVRNQMAGVWEAFEVMPVAGQTVGIIGYGDIGRAVATIVRAVGMRVLAVKRHAQTPCSGSHLVDEIYSPDRRVEMLSRCDYVVAAAPLTAETCGMIGQPEFAAMKSTAVVINVGRGPVINEQAMIRALSTGRIRGAALDVFDQEPLRYGHPFYKLENVLLSPHCGGHTADWLDQAMQFFRAQFERLRKGEPLLNVVNKKLGY